MITPNFPEFYQQERSAPRPAVWSLLIVLVVVLIVVKAADAGVLPRMMDDSISGGGGNPYGWWDDGTVVRLDNIADSVGIGTLTPSAKLHVTGGNAVFEGNVGIGTTPTAKLDVAGDVRWSGSLLAGSVPWQRLTGFPGACPGGQFVTSVGGALTCATAPTYVGGSGSSGYLSSFIGAATIGNSGVFESAGNVGVGTVTPAAKLDVNGSLNAAGAASFGSNVSWAGTLTNGAVPWARLTAYPGGCPAGQYVSAVGGTLTCMTLPQSVGGSGTTNYLSKFTGSTSVGSSNVYDNGTNVGIGTINPSLAKLQTVGDIYTTAGLGFYVPGEGGARNVFYRGGTDFQILRNYNRDYTVQQIWSPPGALGSPSSSEATLALVRGNEPNQEYIDLYNNGYPSETQFGIRIQKRGTGVYRDFAFDQYDGATKTPLMVLKANGNVGIGTTGPTIKLAIGDTDTGLNWAGDGQLDLYSNNINTLNVRSGNVGIGTASPAERLDLGGGNIKMGYEVVTNTLNNVSIASVSCSAGKQVLGGGCDASGGNLIESTPLFTTGWVCSYSGTESFVQARAICANVR